MSIFNSHIPPSQPSALPSSGGIPGPWWSSPTPPRFALAANPRTSRFRLLLLVVITFAGGIATALYYTHVEHVEEVGSIVSIHPAGGFFDVPSDHWAVDAIRWVNVAGIMKSSRRKPGSFEPGALVNRADVATVAARLYKKISVEAKEVEHRVETLQAVRYFLVRLDGQQQYPGIDTQATGIGFFILTPHGLWYNLTVKNPTGKIVVGHLHRGDGKGGSDEVLEEMAFSGNQASGFVILSEEKRRDLEEGRLYVNTHTTGYLKGEIAGWFEPADSSMATSARKEDQ